MAEEIGKLLIRIEADIKGLKKNLNNVTKQVKNTTDKSKKSLFSLQKVFETALGFNLATLTQQATAALKNFFVDGVKSALLLERGMNSLQFQIEGVANSLITDLRIASKNTVSSLELVQTANKALALGIAENQLAELMEVAAARAKVMGITTTQAFNDIATGIGRQSKLILDNLGIIVDLEKAYVRYAAELGVTKDQLSEFDKKQALTNQIIKESEGLTIALNLAMEDQLLALEQLGTFWDEFRLTLGRDIVSAVGKVQDGWKALTAQIGDTVLLESAEKSLIDIGKAVQTLNSQTRTASDNIRSLKEELNNIRDISLTGQAEFDVDERRKVNELDELRLQKLKLINENIITGTAEERKLLEIEAELEIKEANLAQFRLQRKVDSENQLLLAEKQGKLRLQNIDDNEKSLEQVEALIDGTLNQIVQAKDLIAQNQLIVDSYQDQATALARTTRELTAQDTLTGRIARNVFLAGIGTKGPISTIRSAARAFNEILGRDVPTANLPVSASTQGSVVINISTINGIDADAISASLSDSLQSLTSTNFTIN